MGITKLLFFTGHFLFTGEANRKENVYYAFIRKSVQHLEICSLSWQPWVKQLLKIYKAGIFTVLVTFPYDRKVEVLS